MPIVLARVDDRLLHGQIVESWAPHVRADAIVVVSDTVCVDKGRCRLMELIAPENIELCVIPASGLGEVLTRFPRANILLLFADLEGILEVLETGVALDHVNVGNLHHLRGGIEVTPSVFLNRKDLGAVRCLADRGIAVEAREVPDGRSFDIVDYLNENGEGC
ncbi:MAG: PTS sugar transporter subunit IIB [bacterium]|nr:PTS sugar transporter subunit IIB [bacterium]MDT8394906.1 PTS sugar transporter subunit IIB [bacterium]